MKNKNERKDAARNERSECSCPPSNGSEQHPDGPPSVNELRLIHFILSHGLGDDLEDYLSKSRSGRSECSCPQSSGSPFLISLKSAGENFEESLPSLIHTFDDSQLLLIGKGAVILSENMARLESDLTTQLNQGGQFEKLEGSSAKSDSKNYNRGGLTNLLYRLKYSLKMFFSAWSCGWKSERVLLNNFGERKAES